MMMWIFARFVLVSHFMLKGLMPHHKLMSKSFFGLIGYIFTDCPDSVA